MEDRERQRKGKEKYRDKYQADATITRTLEKEKLSRSFAMSYMVYLPPEGSQKKIFRKASHTRIELVCI